MPFVLVTRARGGRGRVDRRGRDPEVGEGWSNRDYVKRRHHRASRKHVAPLLRWLKKNCGRPWREVEGEATAAVDRRTWKGHAVLDLLEMYVSRCQACDWHDRHGFFIQDGILVEGRRHRFHRPEEPDDEPEVKVSDLVRYRRRDGIWYEVRLRHVSEARPGTRDAWTLGMARDPIDDRPTAYNAYEPPYYCWSKLQMGKKELKRAGLRNLV